MTGRVKFYNTEHNYGFIQSPKQDYYFHGRDLLDTVKQDDAVSFEPESHPKGPVAKKIQLVNGKPK